MRAKCLSESLFHGRQITVVPKRKNLPHHQLSPAPHRGRGTQMKAGFNPALMQMASMLSMAMLASQPRNFGTFNKRGRASAPFNAGARGGRR